MSKTAPCDVIALGGDLASGSIMTYREDGLRELDAATEYMRPATFYTPTLYIVGNHDDVPYRGTADRLTRAEMFSRFGRKNLLQGAKTNKLDQGCNYGYMDFENRRMRVIYLNTHDKNGWESTNVEQGESGSKYMNACNVSAKQLHWLANVALDFSDKENQAEWGFVVLSHTQLDIHKGNHTYTDTTTGKTYTANTNNVITILTAYLTNDKGSITFNGETATYDFSNLNNKAYLYGCINGHRHCYEYREYGTKKIPGITCPNTHAYADRENPDGTIYSKVPGTGEGTTFTVITIDRKNGKIYADNHGAGIDRVFDVMVYGSYVNLVPTAITPPTANNEQPSSEIYNGVGYMNNKRISSMTSIVDAPGYVTTGVMTWRETAGAFANLKPIYIKGAELDTTKSYVRMCLIHNINDAGLYCAAVVNDGQDKHTWDKIFTIETLGEQYYKLTPIETGVSWYNIRYFMISLYGSGENLIITVDEPIYGNTQTEELTITNNLTNASTSNAALTIIKGSAYNATISAIEGYELKSVIVTMGGVDVTSTVCNKGVITISSVTGNLVITASASVKESGGEDDDDDNDDVIAVNLLPIAEDLDGSIYNGVGFKADTYLSSTSGNASASTGKYATGFMSLPDVDPSAIERFGKGHVIVYFENIEMSQDGDIRIAMYPEDKTSRFGMKLGNNNFVDINGTMTVNGDVYKQVDDSGNIIALDISEMIRYYSQISNSFVPKWFRISSSTVLTTESGIYINNKPDDSPVVENNLLPISTDSSGAVYNGKGYKENTYLSSGTEGERNGVYCSGFIPAVINDIFYFKNCSIPAADNCRFYFYDADKAYLGGSKTNNTGYNGFVWDDNSNLVSIRLANRCAGDGNNEKIAYMRFCCDYLGNNSIVTRNEPIE